MNTYRAYTARPPRGLLTEGFKASGYTQMALGRLPVGEARFSSLPFTVTASQAIGVGVRGWREKPSEGCLCIGTKKDLRIQGSGGRFGSRTPLPPSGGIKQQKCSLLSSSGGWLPEPAILEGLQAH